MKWKFPALFKKKVLQWKGFSREAEKVSKILSDLKGRTNEERAFNIVQTTLRVFIRQKADKGKLKLKRITNIEFFAGRYNTDQDLKNGRGEPGKDFWIRLLFPEELRGEKIDIEVKSSKEYAVKHRKRYDTHVVIVNPKIPDNKIAERLYNIVFEIIRAGLKEKKGS